MSRLRFWHTAPAVVLFVSLLMSPRAFSQSRHVITPTVAEKELDGLAVRPVSRASRPKLGLVLSGGGARGLAQIGVLQVLERYHIPVDLIVGNSLGSVIGGLYASGYSTAQIESIAVATDWSELLSFSEETKRTDLFVGQKERQDDGYLVIRFDGLQPIIPSSISSGQRLSNFFSTLTLRAMYRPERTFDDLKIPFRAVATDLLTGRRIILDRGSLSEAMRASITVPLLYAPLERDSMSLVDGGLTSNVPVDVARSEQCEVVVAVNSTSPMRNAGELKAPWEIADQIMTIMMQEGNRRQLSAADIVLTPVLGHRLVSDFSNVSDIIEAGRREAESRVPELLELLKKKSAGIARADSLHLHGARVGFAGDVLPVSLRDSIVADYSSRDVSTDDIRSHLDRIVRTGRYHRVWCEVNSGAQLADVVYHASLVPRIEDVVVGGSGKKIVSDSAVAGIFRGLRGRLYVPDSVSSALEGLLSLCRTEGYSLARIESVSVDSASGILSLILHEGRIRQIRYEGNERTRDYVLRREVPFEEGDIFDAQLAARAVANIRSTGLFEYVLLEVRTEHDDPVVIFRVKEKSAELLRLGLHADQEHAFVATVEMRDANFRGAWEDLSLLGRYGYRDRTAKFEYTVNRIFHSYFTAGLRAYFKSRDIVTYRDDPTLPDGHWDRIENGKYKENKYGWGLTFGSHLERLGDITADFRMENHQIAAISGEGYVPERFQFVGLKIQSTLDTEDRFWFPTDGTLLSVSYESASKSLGSEVGYGKFSVAYESFMTFEKRHTFRPRFTFGYADATLPATEQFALGGFRSFYGLLEDDTRGRQLFLANLEYRFWLPFRFVFETYLKVRYDIGVLSSQPEELKLANFRHGIGAELDLDTPIGPAAFGAGKSFYFRRDLPQSPVSVGPLVFYFSVGYTL